MRDAEAGFCHTVSAAAARLRSGDLLAHQVEFPAVQQLPLHELAGRQPDRRPMRIIGKIGAAVRVTARRVWMHLISAYSLQEIYCTAAERLQAVLSGWTDQRRPAIHPPPPISRANALVWLAVAGGRTCRAPAAEDSSCNAAQLALVQPTGEQQGGGQWKSRK